MTKGEWIAEIKQALPESEDATLIITGASGVKYLKLSKATISDLENAQKIKRRVWLVTSFFLFALLLVSLTSYAMRVDDLEGQVDDLDRYQLSVFQALQRLSVEVPELSKLYISNDESDLLSLAEGVSQLVIEQDDFVKFQVESSRRLLSSEHQLRAQIDSLGMNLPNLADSTTVLGAGGFESRASSIGLASLYLDDPLFEMLNQANMNELTLRELPLNWPMKDARVTSAFGIRRHPIMGTRDLHHGLDIVSWVSRDVHATSDGIVTFTGADGGFGNKVEISHANGIVTRYAHLDSIAVKSGEFVEEGQPVGVMGNTGRSTASHLHYEILIDGERVDPLRLIEMADYVR